MGSYSLLVYLGLTNYCDTHGCGSILREFLCHVETLGCGLRFTQCGCGVLHFYFNSFSTLSRTERERVIIYIYIYTLLGIFFSCLALQHLLSLELVVYINGYVKQFYLKIGF